MINEASLAILDDIDELADMDSCIRYLCII